MKEHKFTSPAALYALLLPILREVAKNHGYALGLHGSLNRDLDLIACPWINGASEPVELVEAMQRACEGYWPGTDFDPDFYEREGIKWDRFIAPVSKNKPHGRMTASIYFTRADCGREREGQPYIDLSIMPRLSE